MEEQVSLPILLSTLATQKKIPIPQTPPLPRRFSQPLRYLSLSSKYNMIDTS